MTAARRFLRSIPSWQVALGVALLTLGFLITTQLRTEAPRVRYASNERILLVETAHGLQSQQDGLKDGLLGLRREIQDLESQGQGSAVLVEDLDRRLREARLVAGLTALQGSGVGLQLSDSSKPIPPGGNPTDYIVSARDVRTVVEELWLAGAEAIAVNGERVTATTAIIDIGGSVLVNGAYLAPPYQILAIGPDDLYDQVSGSLGFQEFALSRAEAFGIQVGFSPLRDITLPAYAGTINLRYARPEESAPSAAPQAP